MENAIQTSEVIEGDVKVASSKIASLDGQVRLSRFEMQTPDIPNFLEMPTKALLDKFGAGRHKPGSGTAAALFGLFSCKMMHTVVMVTCRNAKYAANFAQLRFIDSVLAEKHEPYFREAIQRDSVQFDRYHQAVLARNECTEPSEKRRLADLARAELVPATEIPLQIAQHAVETAEHGILIYDLGVRYARGDSGVAVSAALSSCSGALFVVYLNLLQFREGRWAANIRANANAIAGRFHALQLEQFSRVSSIQAEGERVEINQPELLLNLEPSNAEPIQ